MSSHPVLHDLNAAIVVFKPNHGNVLDAITLLLG
jgi:hypothetical protein